MLENINGDIHQGLEYMPITFFSNRLKVGIIGGGRGAFIKARTLIKNGATVEVLSKEFIEEFKELDAVLINKAYYKEFINDKHIIIIAVDDENAINQIIDHCNEISKIYINSSNYKEGMGVIPVKRESKNISISINTKVANPKGAVLIADKLQEEIEKYDEFIEFTGEIRNTSVMEKENKLKLLSFINSEDFRFIFGKGKAKLVLQLFYKEKSNEINISNKEK